MKTIRLIIAALVLSISGFIYCQNNCFSINHFHRNQEIIEMEIDSFLYSSGSVCSITGGFISALSATADIILYGYEGYVRILLSDLENEQDYLVYEAYYPMNSLNTRYHIEDYAYESAMLYNLSNTVLKVEIHQGECHLDRISYSNVPYNIDRTLFEKDKRQLKKTKDSLMIASLNQRIKEENLLWVAGPTSVSELYYDHRRDILPKNKANEIPNLQGMEYYKGGFFEVFTDSIQNRTTNTSNYVDDFDWRNRHGENWVTSAKTQQCTHCWVFCPVSVAESSVNLYFNQHINYDLSEQHVASCSGGNIGYCNRGFISSSLGFLVTNGVVLESCFPYAGQDPPATPCGNACNDPSEIVSFNSYSSIQNNVDLIKKAVIENGPICGGIASLDHFMAIIGFKTLRAGDTLYNSNNLYSIIQPNDPRIGQTYWLFKNSYGTGWGNNGYGYFLPALSDLYGLYKLVTPESMVYDDNNIVCVDNDGDGYYNWGIGPKPATCPDCPDECDCDDSDPTLGPYDNQYGCVSLCDLPKDTTIIINTTQNWNNNQFVNHDIEIFSPGVLTISSTILLNKKCKIIVHPGAKLIIDNGVLTNPCGEMWRGIQVWGDTTANQYEHQGSYSQGYLELKNGATIENAVCAVELWRPGFPATTGGIVHADSAFFVNNAKAVHALNYIKYTYHGGAINYNAWFRKCSFTINDSYLGTETFHEHVELDHVKGISFSGCGFFVDPTVTGVSSNNHGITANTAGFSVDSWNLCDDMTPAPSPCPDNYIIPSRFSRFHVGIHVTDEGKKWYAFGVRDASFTGNECGIYAENTGYATIIHNNFLVGRGGNCSFGIYVDDVSGFCIEDNSFSPNDTEGDTYGIGIFNSASTNDVYLNSFEELTCGNLAVGMNMLIPSCKPNKSVTDGLTYSCNHNEKNDIDFCVLKDNGAGGIRPNQGSPSLAAGNAFSNGVYQFYNDGEGDINYFYSNDTNQVPNSILLLGVTPCSSNSNDCLTHYGTVIKSAEEKKELEEQYNYARNEYERLLKLLNQQGNDASTNAELAALAAEYNHKWRLAAGDIVRSNLMDSVTNPDELKTWLAILDEGVPRQGNRTLGHGGRTADFDCPTLPTGGSKGTHLNNTGVIMNEKDGTYVKVSPNPANTWLQVEYLLPSETSKATFVITNSIGIKTAEVTLEGNRGSKKIDLTKLSSGVYTYSVIGNAHVFSGKLVVVE